MSNDSSRFAGVRLGRIRWAHPARCHRPHQNSPAVRSSTPMSTKGTVDTMRKIHAVSSSRDRSAASSALSGASCEGDPLASGQGRGRFTPAVAEVDWDSRPGGFSLPALTGTSQRIRDAGSCLAARNRRGSWDNFSRPPLAARPGAERSEQLGSLNRARVAARVPETPRSCARGDSWRAGACGFRGQVPCLGLQSSRWWPT